MQVDRGCAPRSVCIKSALSGQELAIAIIEAVFAKYGGPLPFKVVDWRVDNDCSTVPGMCSGWNTPPIFITHSSLCSNKKWRSSVSRWARA